jgi:hypothetical protein
MFSGSIANTSAGSSCSYTIYRDGTGLAEGRAATSAIANQTLNIPLYWIDENPTVAPDTYEVYWQAQGGTCTTHNAKFTWLELQC